MSIVQLRASLALWRSRLAWRTARWHYWQKHHNNAYVAKWEKLRWEAIDNIHLREKQIAEKQQKPHNIVMYDSVTPGAIPANAEAVAGYVGGKWPNYSDLTKEFPKAHHLSIAVNASEDAECLDVEPGDATTVQAPAWVRSQHSKGNNKPVVYSSIANMQLLLDTLAHDSIPRNQVRVFTAHYTEKPHRCSAVCGFGFTGVADATQWTDKSQGRNLDQSLCSPVFFV